MRRAPAAATLAMAATLALSACGLVQRVDDPVAAPTTVESPAPTPPSVPETPTPEPTPTIEPVTVTIAAAGDILSHAPVNNTAARYAGGATGEFDYVPMFADVAPILSAADVALCHLETPLSIDNTGLTQRGVLVFNTPHQMADALVEAGFDGCDFASNHTLDHGVSGLRDTIKVAEAAGLVMAGPTADPETSGQPGMHEAQGVSVAHLAYSYTAFNNWGPNSEVPGDAPWFADSMWPIIGAEGVKADAQAARDAGADIVVVSMHWGQEYVTAPTQDQREIARELLESEAVDVILGTHVHVIQPCETINGRTVFYGLGNFLSNQSPSTASSLRPETQEGMIATIAITRDSDGGLTQEVTYQPTRVQIDGHVVRLATPDQHAETFNRTVRTLGSLGEGACDATPAT